MALRQLTGLSSPRITPNRSPEHAIFAMSSEYFFKCVIIFLLSFFVWNIYPIYQILVGKKNKYRTLFWAMSRHMVDFDNNGKPSICSHFRLCRKNIFSASFVDFFCNLSILRKKGVILMKVKYIFLIMLLLILAVCLTTCASYNTSDKDWPTYDSMSTAVNISFF